MSIIKLILFKTINKKGTYKLKTGGFKTINNN